MIESNYISSTQKQLAYYKMLAEKALAQIPDQGIYWQPNSNSNSIGVLFQHIEGNMLSRFTDFFASDGEKSWRNRDTEFEPQFYTRAQLLQKWESAWTVFLDILQEKNAKKLQDIVYIRNEGHTVLEAINRQLPHYAYHIGQIIYISKLILNEDWKSLSIPKGASNAYNVEKFQSEKKISHYVDEIMRNEHKNTD